MAINPKDKPQLVKDFWPHYRKIVIIALVLVQSILLAIVTLFLVSSGFYESAPSTTLTIVVVQAAISALASIALFRLIAVPMKHLIAALVHVAGERTDLTPPNPNDIAFNGNGLKPVLQTIYSMASSSSGSVDAVSGAGGAVNAPDCEKSLTRKDIEAILDSSSCGFVAMDSKRSITYANKATPIRVDTNGVKSLDLIFNEVDSIEKWWAECDATAVHAEKTWARVPNKLPNEENRRFFDVIASYSKGAASEMVITLVDRTHLYGISEEELEFIAFAAHELRGPITVIRGYLDVLQGELDEVLQPDQKELFSRLSVSASRLSGYINNILNTSRYDRRHLRMHLSETTLKDVYDTISDDMNLRASSQSRALSVNIPADLPTVAADTASLGEVLSNLIDNAVKYSNEGGIINVRAVSKGETVEISVQDNGVGMPGNVVSNLFQKFYRSHRSRETVAGTGIGLYISKAIVESHGGNISVRSEDGHGSTFTVSLPTYKMVADKLKISNNGNETLIGNEGSWIKNHTMYRG